MIETLNSPETYSQTFEGDISLEADILSAGKLMAEGRAIAVDNSSVWAIWGDANDSNFIYEAQAAKQRDPNKTFGLTLSSAHFIEMIDKESLSPAVQELISDPNYFAELIGGFAFVRAPANILKLAEYSIPHSVVSIDFSNYDVKIQNFDPVFSPNMRQLIEVASQEKRTAGKPAFIPAVTSLNPSGTQELVCKEDASAFAIANGLPILNNANASRLSIGSFPILEIGTDVVLKRRGNIADNLLEDMLYELPYRVDPDVIKRSECAVPYELPDYLLDRATPLRGIDLSRAIREDLEHYKFVPQQRA